MLSQPLMRRGEHKLATEIIHQKLSRLVSLSRDDSALIESCSLRSREYPSGVRLPSHRRALGGVVVSGWVGRLRLFADGRRQIVSTMVAGELVGPHPNPFISSTAIALTDTLVADLTPLNDAIERQPHSYPRLSRGLMLAAQLEELQMAEQIVRLGRRTAFERLAHWLLDLQERLSLAGQCRGDTFQMELTQELLSDILGMSIVHVNRIVKQLRSERLIELKNGMITILEPERLMMIAEFTPLSTEHVAEAKSGLAARQSGAALR